MAIEKTFSSTVVTQDCNTDFASNEAKQQGCPLAVLTYLRPILESPGRNQKNDQKNITEADTVCKTCTVW